MVNVHPVADGDEGDEGSTLACNPSLAVHVALLRADVTAAFLLQALDDLGTQDGERPQGVAGQLVRATAKARRSYGPGCGL